MVRLVSGGDRLRRRGRGKFAEKDAYFSAGTVGRCRPQSTSDFALRPVATRKPLIYVKIETSELRNSSPNLFRPRGTRT